MSEDSLAQAPVVRAVSCDQHHQLSRNSRFLENPGSSPRTSTHVCFGTLLLLGSVLLGGTQGDPEGRTDSQFHLFHVLSGICLLSWRAGSNMYMVCLYFDQASNVPQLIGPMINLSLLCP